MTAVVHAENGYDEDKELEEADDEVANVVGPDLHRKELPVLHSVEPATLLWCQLHD